MASVLFGNTIDMLTVATPSSGYIVAYDLDGILKQKDEFGIITEIGVGPTAGMGMTPSLDEVLNTGNITNGNDIILSNDDVIIAATGGALLNLRNGGDGSVLLGLPASTYGGKGGSGDGGSILFLDPNSVLLGLNGGDYSKPYLYLTTQYSQLADYSTHSNAYYGFNLYRNSNFNSYSNGISIKENVTFNFTSVNQDNYSIIIGSRNSTTNAGVFNSPVIGGQSLNATQSNTVYLGNTVNINNAYNLPNVDGSNNQVLKTDGSGNTYWDNAAISGLEDVLGVNNNSGIYSIVMGTGTSITSTPGGQIDLSFGATNSVIISTDYGNLNKAYIRLDDDIITIESNDFNLGVNSALINTFDSRGLVYTFDYSSNFVTHSLIDRNYLDVATNSIWNEIDNINNTVITEVTAGKGLSGGGTFGSITLDVNLEQNSGLTFSGDNITIELNSDSLEVDSNNQIRLKDVITGDRQFSDSVTIAGNLTIAGYDVNDVIEIMDDGGIGLVNFRETSSSDILLAIVPSNYGFSFFNPMYNLDSVFKLDEISESFLIRSNSSNFKGLCSDVYHNPNSNLHYVQQEYVSGNSEITTNTLGFLDFKYSKNIKIYKGTGDGTRTLTDGTSLDIGKEIFIINKSLHNLTINGSIFDNVTISSKTIASGLSLCIVWDGEEWSVI